MKIDWNDSYRVGDDRIDVQHQKLFALANDVIQARSLSAVRLHFMYLYEYVHEHFTDEEALMRNAGYARLKVHVL